MNTKSCTNAVSAIATKASGVTVTSAVVVAKGTTTTTTTTITTKARYMAKYVNSCPTTTRTSTTTTNSSSSAETVATTTKTIITKNPQQQHTTETVTVHNGKLVKSLIGSHSDHQRRMVLLQRSVSSQSLLSTMKSSSSFVAKATPIQMRSFHNHQQQHQQQQISQRKSSYQYNNKWDNTSSSTSSNESKIATATMLAIGLTVYGTYEKYNTMPDSIHNIDRLKNLSLLNSSIPFTLCDAMMNATPINSPTPVTATSQQPSTSASASANTGTGTGTTPRNVMTHRKRSLRGRNLFDKYNIEWELVLGEGAYGSVHPARLKATGEKVALKKISRHYTTESAFKSETDALLRLYDNGGHPNISGLRDMYEDHNYYYLILDLVSGGEMFEHLIKYGAYSEADAARLIHEVASALAFLHGVGIVHMDLKPENLLLSTKNRLDGTIKIIDFGGSYIIDNDEILDTIINGTTSTSTSSSSSINKNSSDNTSLIGGSTSTSSSSESSGSNTGVIQQNQLFGSTGTTAYWSPERFDAMTGKNKITNTYHPDKQLEMIARAAPAFDMWSVGVILYIMLTGVHPFDIEGCSSDDEIEQRILTSPAPPLTDDIVGHLSTSAIDLIQKLMEKDPSTRLTAYQMIQHPWVRGETASHEKIQDSDKKLSQFNEIRHKLDAAMFTIFVGGAYSHATMSEAKMNNNTNNNNHTSDDNNDSTSSSTTDNTNTSNTNSSSNSSSTSSNKIVLTNHDDFDEEEIKRKSATHIMQRAFAIFDAEGKGYVKLDDISKYAGVSSIAVQDYIAAQQKQDSDDIVYVDEQNNNNNNNNNNNDQNLNSTGPAYLSLSQFNKLFSGLNHKHYPRGHYIFHAGDAGDAMYFLNSGKVEIQTRKGQLVAILRNGDFFGEGSLLDPNAVRFTSARCNTPVDVIEIKRIDFDRYMGASPTAKRDIRVKWRARSLSYAKNLLRLQKNVILRTYNKGDIVYKEGDIGTSMYRVADEAIDGGQLEVSHNGTIVHSYVAGDSFGESSLLFKRPRSSTVTCCSEKCHLMEMKGEDFLAAIESSPEMAESLRNMARRRLFKKAVKAYSLEQNRGFNDNDIVQAFHDADIDKSGTLNLDEVRWLMHKMDPKFPLSEIKELLKFADVDEDGQINVDEFKGLFRQFDEAKNEVKETKNAK